MVCTGDFHTELLEVERITSCRFFVGLLLPVARVFYQTSAAFTFAAPSVRGSVSTYRTYYTTVILSGISGA